MGGEDACSRDNLCSGIDFSFEPCSYLARADTASECFGEASSHEAFNASLKIIQKPHVAFRWNGPTPLGDGSPVPWLHSAPRPSRADEAVVISARWWVTIIARVAELVDALASGASARKGVGVQVPSRAQKNQAEFFLVGPRPRKVFIALLMPKASANKSNTAVGNSLKILTL